MVLGLKLLLGREYGQNAQPLDGGKRVSAISQQLIHMAYMPVAELYSDTQFFCIGNKIKNIKCCIITWVYEDGLCDSILNLIVIEVFEIKVIKHGSGIIIRFL